MVPAVSLAAVFLAGCETTGLSLRDRSGAGYPRFIHALYEQPVGKPVRPIKGPISLAVAQIGETSPPQWFLDQLRARTELFSKGVGVPMPGEPVASSRDKSAADASFSAQMRSLCNLSRSQGADCILLIGGSMDSGTAKNAMSVMDLTIVGGAIFPGTTVMAEGKAAGALIEAESGQVLFLVNSEARRKTQAPTHFAYDRKGTLSVELRDRLLENLGGAFADKLAAHQTGQH